MLAGTALVRFLICTVKYVSNMKKTPKPSSNLLNTLITETEENERLNLMNNASLLGETLFNKLQIHHHMK